MEIVDQQQLNHPENDFKPEQMHQKQHDTEQTFKAPTKVKNITNIHCDGLERIFDFLDIESWLNVARTNISDSVSYMTMPICIS